MVVGDQGDKTLAGSVPAMIPDSMSAPEQQDVWEHKEEGELLTKCL